MCSSPDLALGIAYISTAFCHWITQELLVTLLLESAVTMHAEMTWGEIEMKK